MPPPTADVGNPRDHATHHYEFPAALIRMPAPLLSAFPPVTVRPRRVTAVADDAMSNTVLLACGCSVRTEDGQLNLPPLHWTQA